MKKVGESESVFLLLCKRKRDDDDDDARHTCLRIEKRMREKKRRKKSSGCQAHRDRGVLFPLSLSLFFAVRQFIKV